VTTLATVLRGLRARALLSVSSLVMMVLALGGVVLGPMFQQSSIDSYTLTRVDATPESLTALSWSAFDDRRARAGEPDLDGLVAAALAEVERVRPASYTRPDLLLFADDVIRGSDGAVVRYLARDDICATLAVEGRCPTGPGEVLVSRDDLRGLGIGDPLEAPLLGALEIVGVYSLPTTTDDWLFPSLFTSRPSTPPPDGEPYRPAPFVVSPDVFADLRPGLWEVRLESRLRVPDRLSDRAFDELVSDVDRARSVDSPLEGGGRLVGTSNANALAAVLVDVRGQREAARTALAPAVVSLVLVALAMILRLQVAAVGLRAPEQALAALRGLGRRRSWVLGLSEPWLLVLVSVPLGLAAGYGAAAGLARAWLRPGIGLDVPSTSLLGASLVTAALAVVSAGAVAQGMRQTIGERLAGVHRPRPSSRLVITAELVVVLLALALPLTRVGADPDGLGLADLLLPVTVAVAAGLVTTRVIAALATRWTARGAQRPLSVFVAARAVARRSQGTLVVLPVTAAISLAVFAVGVDSVASGWRGSVAATVAPADNVYDSPLTLDETLQLTRDVDPEGRYVMAAGRVAIPGVGTVAVVDSARLGRVGAWPAMWLGGRTGAQAMELVGPTSPVLRIGGQQVSVTAIASSAGATVVLGVRTVVGDQTIRVGTFPAGETTLTDTTGACAPGCLLRSISVDGLDAPLVVTRLAVDGAPVSPPLGDGGWTSPGDGAQRRPVGTDTGGVTVPADATILPSAAVAPLPLLVGVDARDLLGPAGSLETASEIMDVRVAAEAESLPFVGPAGLLADLPSFLLHSDPAPPLVLPAVLVRDDAPGQVLDGLRRAGLVRVGGVADERRSLDDSAYAQALRLYLVVGATLLLMALGGLLVSNAVQVPQRRRDAASLRVVGVPRRTVVLSSVWESVVVLGGAATSGVVAGVAALAVLLPSLELGVTDDATIPRVLADPDVGRLVLVAAAVGVVLLGVATVTSVLVVRRARGASLRETEQ
jgi:hypothetical protein